MRKVGRPQVEAEPREVEVRLRITKTLAARLDSRRGLVTRADWVRELIRKDSNADA